MAGGSYRHFDARVGDLDLAWRDRLDDAHHLMASGRYAAAIAAGLYGLEICLKVRICKKLELDSLPKAFEIHDLEALLILSGLLRRLSNRKARGGILKRNWDQIRDLSGKLNDLRYKPQSSWSHSQAAQFFDQLQNQRDGVRTWLQKKS
jgi:hypothetical protein